ncbi:MAG TPA: ABC transporter permease [Thermoanaerobaculia bacterium]|nr:ABC transporter permease [Thermoanaerobaculia bacterium]
MKLPFWIPWRPARREDELDEELLAHLHMAEADRIARGESPAEAAASARREFGNLGLVKEITREMWGGLWLERRVQDLRFGFRMLRRSPGFSLLAILCLTLGIGANAAVYSWIEGILLRPYPAVAHQETIFALAGTARGTPGFDVVSWPDFDDLRRSCTLFDSFIAEKITGTTLSVGDRAERVTGSLVSANYFHALGVHPVLGRGFEPGEEVGRNAHPVTVISHQLWKGRFNGDPRIVGKTQIFNGVPHTIVGVAPEGFYGTFVGYAFQFWVPASMQETFDSTGYKLEDRGERWIEGFVRLKRGVTRRQAQEEISAAAKRLESDFPATNRGRGIQLEPLWKSPFNNAGALFPTLRIALGVVIFVLLIACANVGNLLLVKSFARRREMTIRIAVGAGRGRLVAQLLTEGLILSAFAAVGGIVVAYWLRNALVLLIPPRGAPMRLAGELDWRVVAASIGVCVISTVLVGLVPALQAGKIDLAGALKSESGGVVGGSGKLRLRSSLVLLQVSLSFLLLVGAGLLIQSMNRIRTASPGFSTRSLTTGVDLLSAGYDSLRAKLFQDQLIDRVRALPTVQSAALSRIRPFTYQTYSSSSIAVDGYQSAPDELPSVEYNEVGPDYFATLGIPLVSGREFTRADDGLAPLVAVVNQTMAARYWRGQDPIGKRVQVKGRWLQVVGVARTAKYQTLLETPKPFFYVPLRQNPSIPVNLTIRTSQSTGTMATALAREIHALDKNIAPSEVITMREQVDRSTASQRVAVTLLGAFGGLALLLAAIGLYGVMSHAVSQSTRELGLRMALGARASDLVRLVLSHGFTLTGGGIVLGAATALGLTRLLGYLLYEVSPRDPLAFGSAFLVMAIAALAACLVPAWRATRTDPVRALKD